MTVLTTTQYQTLATAAGNLDGGIRPGYIGRGPTEPCVGVIVGAVYVLWDLAIEIIECYPDGDVNEAVELLKDLDTPRLDNMGREVIVYWPDVQAPEGAA